LEHPWAVTPCGIWPHEDVRVRLSYLEEEGRLIKEAEGLHDSWAFVKQRWPV